MTHANRARVPLSPAQKGLETPVLQANEKEKPKTTGLARTPVPSGKASKAGGMYKMLLRT